MILLALLSSVVLGAADLVGGLAARRARAGVVVIWSNAAGLLLALAVSTGLSAHVVLEDLGWGVLAGCYGSFGAVLLYRALAIGTMSVVAPTTAATAALIPLAVGLRRGDHLGLLALLGVVAAVVSVVLIARGRPDRSLDPRATSAALVLAVGAGISFGAFLVALAGASPASGLWPVVGARVSALAVLVTVAVLRRQPLRLPRPAAGLSLLAGVLDIAANVAFLLALRTGPLAVVGLLASLSPLGTALLARILLGERLLPVQRVGAALAMGSVVLFALR